MLRIQMACFLLYHLRPDNSQLILDGTWISFCEKVKLTSSWHLKLACTELVANQEYTWMLSKKKIVSELKAISHKLFKSSVVLVLSSRQTVSYTSLGHITETSHHRKYSSQPQELGPNVCNLDTIASKLLGWRLFQEAKCALCKISETTFQIIAFPLVARSIHMNVMSLFL